MRISLLLPALVLATFSNLLHADVKRKNNTISMGVGFPYGLLGYSYDRKVSDKLELRAASGIPFFWDGGWPYTVGAKYYFKDEGFWNPRVSLMYGTQVIENFGDTRGGSNTYPGLSLGIGQSFLLGRTGRLSVTLDLDFIYSELPQAYLQDWQAAVSAGGDYEKREPVYFSLDFGLRF